MAKTVIVVPCYNEAERLPRQVFLDFLDSPASAGVTILFANDGSTDATREVLEELRAQRPARIRAVHLSPNGGKAEAVRRGFNAAFKWKPDFIGYWDADLATPLDEIPTFLEAMRDHPAADVVLGARVQLLGRAVRRKMIRHYLGRIFATVASTYLRIGIYDTQCGAKLFRMGPDVPAIFREKFVSRWLFDVELIVRFLKRRRAAGKPAAEALYEQPLRKWEDVGGSKVRGKDFVRALGDFGRIMMKYR